MTLVLTASPELGMMVHGLIPPVPALVNLDLAATIPLAHARKMLVLFPLELTLWAIWWLSRACLTATNCILPLPTICVAALAFWFMAVIALVTHLRDALLFLTRTPAIWLNLELLWRLWPKWLHNFSLLFFLLSFHLPKFLVSCEVYFVVEISSLQFDYSLYFLLFAIMHFLVFFANIEYLVLYTGQWSNNK